MEQSGHCIVEEEREPPNWAYETKNQHPNYQAPSFNKTSKSLYTKYGTSPSTPKFIISNQIIPLTQHWT